MRIYAPHEEEDVKAQQSVREWAASKHLTATQAAQLEKETDPGLQRTSTWLRWLLFLFTLGSLAAFLGLLVTLHIIKESSMGIWMTFAVLSYGLAEYLVQRGRQKLYRYGIEEALVVFAVGMCCLAVITGLTHSVFFRSEWRLSSALVSFVAAGAWGYSYLRFGYVYAGLAALLSGVAVPGILFSTPIAQRSCIAGLFFVLACLLDYHRRRHRLDFLDSEYSVLQATLLLGCYLTLNVRITSLGVWKTSLGASPIALGGYPAWFYWMTYLSIWLIPIFVLFKAVREKDRALLNIGIVIALLTLVTNKPYLGWTRHEWDPMMLGVFLIAIGLWLRRWLTQGSQGLRYGFTAERISESDKRLIAALGTVSAVWQPGLGQGQGPAAKPDFGAGRSGGGGASGQF